MHRVTRSWFGLGVEQVVFLEEVLHELSFEETSRSRQGAGFEGHRAWLRRLRRAGWGHRAPGEGDTDLERQAAFSSVWNTLESSLLS